MALEFFENGIKIRGVSWGRLWGPRPPGSLKGAPKKEKGKERERKREEKEGKKGKKKEEDKST